MDGIAGQSMVGLEGKMGSGGHTAAASAKGDAGSGEPTQIGPGIGLVRFLFFREIHGPTSISVSAVSSPVADGSNKSFPSRSARPASASQASNSGAARRPSTLRT